MHLSFSRRKHWHFIIAALSVVIGVAWVMGLSSCDGSSIVLPGENSIIVNMTPLVAFDPLEITVQPGDVVKLFNTDTDPHAPNDDPGNLRSGGPNSDAVYPNGVSAGQSYSWSAPANAVKGTKWFCHCRVHGTAGDGKHLGTGMAGVIFVK